MRVIILGAGAIGAHLADLFSKINQDIVVIDDDEQKLERIQENCDLMTVHSSGQITLMAFFIAYFALCFTAFFIMILVGVDSTNSFTIALSCGSNVGPTLGLEIGPTMSWSILPDFVKWILSALMLMGRLEIFTFLVLFVPSFWKNN